MPTDTSPTTITLTLPSGHEEKITRDEWRMILGRTNAQLAGRPRTVKHNPKASYCLCVDCRRERRERAK